MAVNRFKERNMQQPIEKHDTAALTNIETAKKISRVTIPSETQTINSKEWVDVNEK